MTKTLSKSEPDSSAEPKYLWHYTKKTFAKKILEDLQLILVKPEKWPDQNDREIVNYLANKLSSSIYIQCYTNSSQKHHFWIAPDHEDPKVAVCLDYKELKRISFDCNFILKKVEYVRDNEIKSITFSNYLDALFKKRNIYSNENEYRIAHITDSEGSSFYHPMKISKSIIRSVIVSPFASDEQFKAIKCEFQAISGFAELRVKHSRATKMPNWIRRMKQQIDNCDNLPNA